MSADDTTRSPTSFDVARKAGVSRSTVSRTFTAGARVSPEVRARVLEAADTLGYRVNALARGLQARHSNLVGVVASRLDTPYRALQVRCIAQGLLREGMNPLLLVADGGEDVRALIQNILAYSVAGVIVTSDTPSPEVVRACNKAGVPVVMINRGPASAGADTVCMDLEAGGRAAFEMLRTSGATRFGVVTPEQETYSVTGRANAFLPVARARAIRRSASQATGRATRRARPLPTRSWRRSRPVASTACSARPISWRSVSSTGCDTSAGSTSPAGFRSWASTISNRPVGALMIFRPSGRASSIRRVRRWTWR
jgi:DNA-binding LacI/PurR family transcriptional regulator